MNQVNNYLVKNGNFLVAKRKHINYLSEKPCGSKLEAQTVNL